MNLLKHDFLFIIVIYVISPTNLWWSIMTSICCFDDWKLHSTKSSGQKLRNNNFIIIRSNLQITCILQYNWPHRVHSNPAMYLVEYNTHQLSSDPWFYMRVQKIHSLFIICTFGRWWVLPVSCQRTLRQPFEWGLWSVVACLSLLCCWRCPWATHRNPRKVLYICVLQ